ncbi:DUF11 domain-containing protein [bacterium]|nr:DUF11 domain-containing protein [bacterium]
MKRLILGLVISFGLLVFGLTDSWAQITKLTSHQVNVVGGKYCVGTNSILFISDRGGNIDLWKMNPDGSNPVQLTNDSAFEEEAAFSPNGQQIAYVIFEGTNKSKLYVMDADGVNKLFLVDAAGEIQDLKWSPDGKKIGYLLGSQNENIWEEDVWVVDVVSGSIPQQLTTEGKNYSFSWSQDGGKIVYEDYSAAPVIYIINADGTGKGTLTNGMSPVCSPDGNWIAFKDYNHLMEGGEKVAAGIFLIDPAGSETVCVSEDTGYNLLWSPDSKRLIISRDNTLQSINIGTNTITTTMILSFKPWAVSFSSDTQIIYDNIANIYSLSLNNGTTPQALTNNSLPGIVYGGKWSKNGEKAAYITVPNSRASGTATGEGISIVNKDGSTSNEVVAVNGWINGLVWSPVGDKILYGQGGENSGIWIVNATNSQTNRVADESFDRADWSPDGTRVVYHGNNGLYIADLNSGTATFLAEGSQPDWAPAGNAGDKIAYHNWTGTGSGIGIISTLNGEMATLTTNGGWFPCWSPDGKKIAYFNENGLWVVDVGSQSTRNVYAIGTGSYVWSICWSPDSQQIAFSADDNNIYTVGVNGSNLSKINQGGIAFGVDWSSQNMLLYCGIGGGGGSQAPHRESAKSPSVSSKAPPIVRYAEAPSLHDTPASARKGGDLYAIRMGDAPLSGTITGTISGTISYSGTKTGTAYVVYSIDPFFRENPEMGATFTISNSGSYSFTMGNIPVGTYAIDCWFDAESPYGWGAGLSFGDVLGLYGGTFTIVDGEPEIIGTPTSVVVEAGSASSGVDFELNYTIPSLPRIPMPFATIIVDGTGTDWIQPAGTDTQGDNIAPGTGTILTGSDLKSVSIARDEAMLYLRLDLWGNVNPMFQNNNSNPARCGSYRFQIRTNANTCNNIELAVVSCSDSGGSWTIQAWDRNIQQNILMQAGTVATNGGTIELSLPLSALGYPSEFTIKPMVGYHHESGFQGKLDRMSGFVAYLPPPEPVNVDLRINGTTFATTVAVGTLTVTCNSSPVGRVEFYNYLDSGTIGVLDANDIPLPDTFFEIDNSHTDENSSISQIKRTTLLFNGTVVTGDGIIQAIDMTTGSSSYVSIKFTPPAYSQSISGVVKVDGVLTPNMIIMAMDGSDNKDFVAVTGANGQYTLNLPAGNWKVQAFKLGCMPSKEKEVYLFAGSSTIAENSIIAGNSFFLNFDISAIGLAAISGKITCDGKPAKGVRIQAESENGNRTEVVTGSEGTYTLYVNPADIWILKPEKAGYNSSPQWESVSDFPATVDFVLTQNKAAVIGTITGSGGIFGARVGAYNDGYADQRVITNVDGHYSLYLPASSGVWHINAGKSGSAYSGKEAYPWDKNIDLTLNWHNGTITGTVYAPNGTTGLGFVGVEARMEKGYQGLWDRVNTNTFSDGTYQLPVLAGYTYVVTAEKKGYGSPAPQSVSAGSVSATANFVMLGADLWINKWAERASSGANSGTNLVCPGATFTYHIAYGNRGEGTAGSVTITDTLPIGVTLVTSTGSFSPTISTSGSQTVLTYQVGRLNPNEKGHFELVVSVSSDMPASTTLTNVAQISTPEYEGTQTNNSAAWSTHVFKMDMSISKWGQRKAIAGKEITYRITFNNMGNIDAPDVVITDILPSGLTYAADTLGNASVTVTGTGTVIVWEIGTVTANTPQSFDLTVLVGSNTVGTLTNRVEFTTTETEFTLLNNSSMWSTCVEAPIRNLIIKKQGLTVVKTGTRMRYGIGYSNMGNVDIHDIVIIDTLPTGVSYVKDTSGVGTFTEGTDTICWDIGTLLPNERGYFELVVDVTGTGTLVNVVEISGTGTEANYATWTTNAVSGVVDLVIDKKGPTQVISGGTITYTISYDNHGNADAGSATIRDTLPQGFEYAACTLGSPTTIAAGSVSTVMEWVVGTITPWSYNRFNLTVKVNAPGGEYTNKAEIISLVDSNSANNLSTVTTKVSTPIYDLFVRKWGPGEATPGQQITYGINYGNQGNIKADHGTITDILPLGVQYGSSSPAGSVTGEGVEGDPFVVTWSGSDNWGYIKLTVEVGSNTPSATLTNVVRIEGTSSIGGSDPVWNNQATVTTIVKTPIVDLRIRKSGQKQAKPGQKISYTISYANQGNTPATATITDVLPDGVSYVSDTSEVAHTIVDNKIIWEVGTVIPGNSIASGVIQGFGLTVLVGTNTQGGTLTNVVSISTSMDNNPANNHDTAVTYIVQPVVDLSITKSAPGEVAPGQMMTYHITYRNKGNTEAGSVTITDEFPSGVTYWSDTSGFGATTDGNKITWCLGTVFPSLWAKSFKVKVEVDNLPAGTMLDNRIKIEDAEAIDNNSNDNQATATTRVAVPVGDLSIHKAGPAEVAPNSVITYYIGYKNKGNIEAGSVTIIDTLPVGVSYLSDNSGFSTSTIDSQIIWQLGTLKPGKEGRFSVKAFVGQIQGSSTLTNSVMISSTAIQDEDTGNDVASLSSHVVSPSTDLIINKFGPRSVAANQEMTYKITYANLGNSEARDIEIMDILPDNTIYKGDTSGISPLLIGDTVIWQVSVIPANTAKFFELTVFVGDVPAPATLTNQVKITTLDNDTNKNNNNADWQTHIVDKKADVMVTKQGTGARPGWDKTYYITYKNIGTDRTEEVVVVDLLPAGVIYLSSSPACNYDAANHSLTWDIGNINAYEGGNITVYVNVDGNTVVPGDKLKNTVKISTISPEKRYDNNIFVEEETARGSIDPNDKLASPQDFLSDVRDTREISYKVRFENVAGSYTLPAREVRIIDKLDANMNWDTLEMGDVGIGTRTYPLGTWSHGTTYGTVSYSFDKTTGSITWYFVGEDSALPPIETGFLPPNETKPQGEGYVSYSIKAKEGVSSGTVIKNKANIRFDYNPWIETPEICHILDITPPSAMVTVAPSQGTITFEVTWSGIDTVGSISNYTVSVADTTPYQTYTAWISGTTATSALFTGTVGNTYYFCVAAEDRAGNTGQLSAPAITTIILDANIDGFEVNLNQVIVYPNPNLSDKHGYNIYFDRLTENSTIKIFNIAGELVREITVQSSPQSWDTCNSDGERVASGIYIYLITDPAGNKKTGKLGIIR